MPTTTELLAALKADLNTNKKLVNILANQAEAAGDPNEFYKDAILAESNLYPKWKSERAGARTVNAQIGARQLVNWALAKNVNINRGYEDYTAIGSILEPLMGMVGGDEARDVAAIIVAYRLYLNPDRLQELMTKYKIPAPLVGTGLHGDDINLPVNVPPGQRIGPVIDWKGPDEKELQAFWQQPDYFDVGFLRRAMDAALSVCRIELPSKERLGTGFLIEPGLLLTNYHVLKDEEDPHDDINANAAEALLRFGYVTSPDAAEPEIKPFKLVDEKPILDQSPSGALDFVLLKVEDTVKLEKDIKPLPNKPKPSAGDKGLNVIQHPAGETMKIALSSNGRASVDDESGLIQYVSKTAGGSSGSPCFNNNWDLVAIHHAEISTLWGSRREGILYSRIYERIKGLLQ
jgi:V8-like Glu-specific endopeptidase